MDLREFQCALEEYAASNLNAYTEGLCKELVPSAPKEFSDPVWKTIYLTPFEVAIVDNPLCQRLRLIKQLGVAHWVYPGAIHTRFEHCLGALFQVQELIESINRSARGRHELLISAADQSLLRLTALCHDLGHGVMSHVSAGEPYYVMFGLAYSGARTLDELLLGRILLFDKLYRHQKVRAAEGMVSLLLFNLAKLFKRSALFLPYFLTDEQIVFADLAIRNTEGFDFRPADEECRVAAAVIGELSQCLRERRLFIRAFAFAKNMPGDPYRYDPTQRVGANKLLSDLAPEKRAGFVAIVASEVLTIFKQLKLSDAVVSEFKDHTLVSYIYIDPPQPPAHAGDIPHAFLMAEDGRIGRFRETSTEMLSWTDAYLFAKDIGYVFCPRRLKPYVFLAVEKILREKYELRSFPAMFDYVKQDASIDLTKRALHSNGYYSSSPHDLRPKASRLLRGDIPAKFQSVRTALQGYSGPYVDPSNESLTAEYLTHKHLEDWLQQFETEQLIASACSMLAKIRLIGRPHIFDALTSFMKTHEDFKEAVVAPLGDIRDSGPSIAYFSGDVAGVEVMEIGRALQNNRPIILVDDFIGSGKQAVTILETLLSGKLTHDLEEGVRRKLDENERGLFLRSRLAFVYAAGWKEGQDELLRVLHQYQSTAEVHLGISNQALPSIYDIDIFSAEEDQSAFIEKCREIGRSLLLSPNDPEHDEQWAEERALGYGNKGLLITFPYNTPSQTLTCIWKNGEYNGLPWQALLPRRKKK